MSWRNRMSLALTLLAFAVLDVQLTDATTSSTLVRREELGVTSSATDDTDADGNAPSCLDESSSFVQLQRGPTGENFDHTYRNHDWGDSGSLSGAGSNIDTTSILCKTLHAAVRKFMSQHPKKSKIRILDAPSGDWYWMPHCLHSAQEAFPTITFKYQGIDVSSVAVGLAEKKRKDKSQLSLERVSVKQFQVVDLASPGSLKKFGRFDIIISHDCLQHNPLSNVWKILHNFNHAAKILVIDVDRANGNARDLPEAGSNFRPIDITQAPFNQHVQCMDPNTMQPKDAEDEWFGIFDLPMKLVG